MHRRRVKIEEKELDFVFQVVSVQFNQPGRYQLILTAENPLLESSASEVRLRVGGGKVQHTNTISTGTIEQTCVDDIYPCTPNTFVFTLPKGYCKNDKNHDVRLKVEALLLPDSNSRNVEDTDTGTDAGRGTKAGEGFFAIYPRTNAPRINLFAGPDEELYRYTGIMALLRAHQDHLAMHCGRLVYTVAFHQARAAPAVVELGESGHIAKDPAEDPGEPGGGGGGRGEDSDIEEVDPDQTGDGDQRKRRPAGEDVTVVPLQPGSSALPGSSTLPAMPPLGQTGGTGNKPQDLASSLLLSSLDTTTKLITTGTDVRMDLGGTEPWRPSSRDGGFCRPDWTHSTLSQDHLLLHPFEDTPPQSPEPLPYTHVIESPRRADASSVPQRCGHVSRPGEVLVCVTFHGATSLPPLSNGDVPQPFAMLAVGSDEARGRGSRGVTRATLLPTHSPSWEDTLAVELQDEQARGEELVLSVADGVSRELLAYYRLPVAHLQPFQHYHLELMQTHLAVPSGVRLYVSMVLKTSILPRQPCFSFTGFEVLLEAMTSPLRDPVGPLLAVARIVADYDFYRDTVLLRTPCVAGIAVTSALFPDPPEDAFSMPPITIHGRPQVSPAGVPQERPVWRHSFLFLGRDVATIFTEGAALVLELYPTTTVMNSVSWHLRSPVAFCVFFLDQSLYRKLMSEQGQRGYRVPQLPLQGGHLQTTAGSAPAVSITIRLIGSERPDSVLAEMDNSLLPCLDPDQQQQGDLHSSLGALHPLHPDTLQEQEQGTGLQDTHISDSHLLDPDPKDSCLTDAEEEPGLQRESFGLPSYDALAQILPDYQHLFRTSGPPKPAQGPSDEPQSKQKEQAQKNSTYEVHNPPKRAPIPDFPDDAHLSSELSDHQNKEVDNYRTAMCKMAEDIIALRSQLGALEAENSRLRSDLSLHHEVGRTLLMDTDVDVMTKAEIEDRIVSLKVKLASESSKAVSQRDKIQQLQNELIRKNDSEKELESLRRVHQQQQAELQRYQSHGAKMAALENTVHQQEKVIEKMERVLDTKLRERNKENEELKKLSRKDKADSKRKEIESVLAAENARLREELQRMRSQPAPVVIQQPPQPVALLPDREMLSLLGQLEKAEARIRALESQLKANSRDWGREKQALNTKLSEHQHGFQHSSTLLLHDGPTKSVTQSVIGRIRHRQLDPLK